MKHTIFHTILIGILIFGASMVKAQETIEFPSKDGLLISADLYRAKESDKFIILYHQAGWSRGEYQEIAPWLVKIGYNCLAVDLRSGKEVNGIANHTNLRAVQRKLPTKYIHSFPDIEASVVYLRSNYNPLKIIIWGSSYSSSLVLKYAGDYPDKIDGVLSFSSGEYFGTDNFISKSAAKIVIPVFITSAKNEEKSWRKIFEAIKSNKKEYFLPKTLGNHGSRALWAQFEDHEFYRKKVSQFLKQF
ncbi:alpha/beta hydrolase [Ascidiimonas sp. W6]|uniref:alpha/beta hydrolase n=1 Tax=Ascidiimonas meishanensis TaxID=3128903 RepID=UPI0030EE177E